MLLRIPKFWGEWMHDTDLGACVRKEANGHLRFGNKFNHEAQTFLNLELVPLCHARVFSWTQMLEIILFTSTNDGWVDRFPMPGNG